MCNKDLKLYGRFFAIIMMKILLVNKFLFPKGGDAISTLATGRLLAQKGHEVHYWGMSAPQNPEYPLKELFVSPIDYNKKMGLRQQLREALNILYSMEAKRKMEALIEKLKPDIVHLNNFAHQLSPSILDVFHKHGIPSVMTMRDYKLVCPAYTMLSDGKPCERCKDGRYYHCLLRRCTKGSMLKSLVNTFEMYLHHRIMHIYDKIDTFISPSRFLMEKVKEMGFRRRLVHLPNFVDTGEFKPRYGWDEESIVYAGRLSHEKGVATLIEALRDIGPRLKIIGDGPLKEGLEEGVISRGMKSVEFLGYRKGEELKEEIRRCMFVVLPSEWYENNPRIVIEAFALGKPVVGARIGGIPELVRDGQTGYTFRAGDPEELRARIESLLRDKDSIVTMGRKAREWVKEELNPEKHYKELMEIYKSALR